MAREPKAQNRQFVQKKSRRRPSHNPSSTNNQTVVWKLGSLDKGGNWSFSGISDREWWDSILPKLRGFESMTWAVIMNAAGGKSKGTNNYPVKCENLSKKSADKVEGNRSERCFGVVFSTIVRDYTHLRNSRRTSTQAALVRSRP